MTATTKGRAMTIDDEVIVGGIMAAVIGFVGWVIRAASRELLDGFRKTMEAHGRSLDSLTKVVGEMRVEMAEFRARLAAVERRDE